MSDSTAINVRFKRDDLDALATLAKSRGCSRSEAIRAAVELGLPLATHGVTLTPDELDELAPLAKARNCTKGEALRAAITAGLPLVQHGFTLNVTRLLFILEHLGASIDVIMARDHADVYEGLNTLANKRMEQFHA